MALAPCPECGHEVSDKAAACPHCGAPVAQQPTRPNVLEDWIYGQLAAGVPRREVVNALVHQSGMTESAAEQLARRIEAQAVRQSGGLPARQGSSANVAAAFASFFIPGLGQLTQGRAAAGIGMFVLSVALWAVLLGWIVNIWSAVDAARWEPDA